MRCRFARGCYRIKRVAYIQLITLPRKPKPVLLSVIIVSYNVKFFLEQCLCAVLKASQALETEIIVVDNNSADQSREWLEHKFPTVRFLWLKENLGFGAANNIALRESTGAYVLFLNPDTIIAEDTVELCIAEFQKRNNAGALGVRMIDGSGKYLRESKRGFPGAAASFFKMTGFASLFSKSKLFAQYYAGHMDDRQTHEVDVLAGAFMMLTRQAINITKGFDEDFFMYGEDVDLSYRITKAGLKNIYFAGTTIIHFKGESTQKFSPSYNEHFYGAMRLFTEKHFAEKKILLFITGAAIRAGKLMAAAKSSTGPKNEVYEKRYRRNTAIIANQASFDKCLQLVKYAIMPIPICGRIAVDTPEKGKTLGRLDELKKLLNAKAIQQLIFCESDISFKETIRQVEALSPGTYFLFHAAGSESIVGSDHRNTRGLFISKPLNS
ncbi:MAG: glycosyltransferase family 2 protein [Chitinophagaceae bacterium]|nr:MAG: glycosyltransferase family 2 protein [Chitinophagaceae bacterium]